MFSVNIDKYDSAISIDYYEVDTADNSKIYMNESNNLSNLKKANNNFRFYNTTFDRYDTLWDRYANRDLDILCSAISDILSQNNCPLTTKDIGFSF